ncbi:MAG: tetratricopeptide repeat protein [Planctomycetota bacterium]
MKAETFIIIVVVLVALFSGVSWGQDSGISPYGLPLSATQSGLVQSINPIDNSGNRIVTGNVAGGKHFRGIVPYRATSDFSGDTATTFLDPFLRRSAGTGYIDNISGYQPYYSPSGTVAIIRDGHPVVFRPTASTIDVQVQHPDTTGILLPLPEVESVYDQYSALPGIITRPLSTKPVDLDKIISGELGYYFKAQQLADEQRRTKLGQLRSDFEQMREKADELQQILKLQDESPKVYDTKTQSEDFEQFLPDETMQTPESEISGDKWLDVYEQMKQLDDNLKILLEQQESQDVNTLSMGQKTGDEKGTGEGGIQRKSFSLEGLSNQEISARAKAILGPYQDYESFLKDKFSKYMSAGEMYLKRGKYYRAADAYSLALLYKPADAFANAGESHALFAAGEYMSSALYLSRALDISSEYAGFKIDFVALIGDRDRIESRVAEIEEWLKRSDAGELHFLLGYVYYRMDRLEKAKESIAAASEKMPSTPAVNILKKAIDAAAETQEQDS